MYENALKEKLGLIVNPIAGMGGRVGLKGGDGAEILQAAKALGATPQTRGVPSKGLRACNIRDHFELVAYPGEMGADEGAQCGFEPMVPGPIRRGATTAADTGASVGDLLRSGSVCCFLREGTRLR
jgi:predicted polyphosphate/ATP-dependent NAD kinase